MPGYALNIDPLPTVEPMGAPANDTLRINATPDMFGAAIGRGLEKLGEGTEKAANAGVDILREQREMQDKTRAADIHSTAANAWSQNSGQFLTLEGRAALNALPAYKQRNQEILDTALGEAEDPYTKLLIQTQSRRIMDSHNEMAERHAAGQEKTYQHNVAKLSESASGNQAVLFATNGDIPRAQKFLFDAAQEVRNQAHLQGYEDNKVVDQLVAQNRGQYVYQIVEGIARKEGPGYGPQAAIDFYKTERENIDAASATKIEAFLHGDISRIAAQKSAEDIWRRAGHNLTENLTGRMTDVRGDAEKALAAKGISLNVTSGYRSPEYNAMVHGVTGSQHLHGNAIDISLNGLTEGQQRAVIDQFLSDPRVGGFGYYPNSNSIHVDVRGGDRAAWGTSRHSDTVGEGWPTWMTQAVRAWQGAPGSASAPSTGAPPMVPANFLAGEPTTEVALPSAARSGLPSAVSPTWEMKKALSVAEAMSSPDLRDRPLLRDQVIGNIHRMAEVEHAATADSDREEKLAERQRKANALTVEDEYLKDAYSPNPKKSFQDVVNDPRLANDPDTKKKILALMERADKPDPVAPISRETTMEMFRRMGLPEGDPKKITDVGVVNEAFARGMLTRADHDWLVKTVRERQGPDGENLSKRVEEFLKGVEPQIDQTDINYGIKDLTGKERLYRFRWDLAQAMAKDREEKKNPWNRLDPTKPEYMGRPEVLEHYKKPPEEVWADYQRAHPTPPPPPQQPGFFSRWFSSTPAAPAAPPTIDPATVTPVELRAAVAAGQIPFQDATKIATDRGWIAPRAVAPPVASPPPMQVPVSRPESPPAAASSDSSAGSTPTAPAGDAMVERVRQIQRRLSVPETGVFDERTRDAVIGFRKSHSLESTAMNSNQILRELDEHK